MHRSLGIAANPNIKGGGIQHPGFLRGAPVGEFGFAELHTERRLGMRLQGDALESFQFAHWPRSASGLLVDVKLRHFVSGDGSGIFHIKGDFDGFPGLELRATEFQV